MPPRRKPTIKKADAAATVPVPSSAAASSSSAAGPVIVILDDDGITCDTKYGMISDGLDTRKAHGPPDQFPVGERLRMTGRLPDQIPTDGDGNCMLHAYIATSNMDKTPDELRVMICETMRSSFPSDAWRRAVGYDNQGPINDEATQWGLLTDIAAPNKIPAPYLKLVHLRALAIAMKTIIIELRQHDQLRCGGQILKTQDLVEVFMPDPQMEYVGVQVPLSSKRRRGSPARFAQSAGNRWNWEDFPAVWNGLSDKERNSACILVYDGLVLHYSGTALDRARLRS